MGVLPKETDVHVVQRQAQLGRWSIRIVWPGGDADNAGLFAFECGGITYGGDWGWKPGRGMKLGVLSDSHDRMPAIDAVLTEFEQRGIEVVIHAGDLVAPFAAKRLRAWPGELHVIFGNNDGERAGLAGVLPQIQDGPLILELGGRRVLVHHFMDWCDPKDLTACDVIITGHTHGVVNETCDGKLVLNPGESCGWLTGRCTAAVVDTDALQAEIIEVTP